MKKLHCFMCGNDNVLPPRMKRNMWVFECPDCGEITTIKPEPEELDGLAYDKLAQQWSKVYGISS